MTASRLIPAVAAVLIALVLTGCKSDEEKAMSAIVDHQKKTVEILKTVTDVPSAKAAKEKLAALRKETEEYGKSLEKGKEGKTPDEATMKKLVEKYQPQMEQAQKDLAAERMRIMKIPGASEALGGNFFGL
jgi:hypothetical protein